MSITKNAPHIFLKTTLHIDSWSHYISSLLILPEKNAEKIQTQFFLLGINEQYLSFF